MNISVLQLASSVKEREQPLEVGKLNRDKHLKENRTLLSLNTMTKYSILSHSSPVGSSNTEFFVWEWRVA